MNKVSKKIFIFNLVFLCSISQIKSACPSASDLAEQRPVASYVLSSDSEINVVSSGSRYWRPITKNIIIPSSVLAVCWWLNKIKEEKIAKVNKVVKKWTTNTYVPGRLSNDYEAVSKSFHWSSWRLGKFDSDNCKYIYNTINPDKCILSPSDIVKRNESEKPDELSVMKEMLGDIKGRADGEPIAFVLHSDREEVINSKENSSIAKYLLAQLLKEINALRKDIKELPYVDEINKIFLKACSSEDKKIEDIDQVHKITDEKLSKALRALNEKKKCGILFLDKLGFDFSENETYQKLCKVWSKKYNCAVDAYIKLVPLYARLTALRATVNKYLSNSRPSGFSRIHADLDFNG